MRYNQLVYKLQFDIFKITHITRGGREMKSIALSRRRLYRLHGRESVLVCARLGKDVHYGEKGAIERLQTT